MSEIRKYNLSEVADLVTGSTPRTDNEKFWNGSIPFYSPADFNGSIFCEHTEKTVSESGAKSGRLIPQGSIMVTYIGTIGKIAISSTDGITNQQINTLLVKTGFDARYVYYVVLNNRNKLKQAAPQTTIPILNKTDFGKFRFDFHEFPQQIKIAEILSTIDRTITHTEALIEKYQQIKAGLMHDLFTRGIGADGKLRPTRDKAPELYQESSIGWIPKEWGLVKASHVITAIDAGKSPECPDKPASADQWGVLKVSAVSPDGLRQSENKVVEKIKHQNPDFIVKQGDLLITRANTPELVGMVCYVEQVAANLILSDKTLRLHVDKNRVDKRYLYWALQRPETRNQIEICATGSSASMKNISQKDIRNLQIALPKSLDEQEIIRVRLDSILQRIGSEKNARNKLTKQKSGLMHDLLTGTVQVNSEETI
jgi:type I restriction enzyme, S subunit